MASRNDITGDELRSKALSQKGKENHVRIFGDRKPVRGSWVWDSTQGKMVEKAQYATNQRTVPDVFVDNMEAYDSPITGEVVKNRKQRDIDLKKNGCRPYEGFKTEKLEADKWQKHENEKLQRTLRETMERTKYEIDHGYRKLD